MVRPLGLVMGNNCCRQLFFCFDAKLPILQTKLCPFAQTSQECFMEWPFFLNSSNLGNYFITYNLQLMIFYKWKIQIVPAILGMIPLLNPSIHLNPWSSGGLSSLNWTKCNSTSHVLPSAAQVWHMRTSKRWEETRRTHHWRNKAKWTPRANLKKHATLSFSCQPNENWRKMASEAKEVPQCTDHLTFLSEVTKMCRALFPTWVQK